MFPFILFLRDSLLRPRRFRNPPRPRTMPRHTPARLRTPGRAWPRGRTVIERVDIPTINLLLTTINPGFSLPE